MDTSVKERPNVQQVVFVIWERYSHRTTVTLEPSYYHKANAYMVMFKAEI